MSIYQITSESVTEGHPDKICDQISDAILDAYLTQDPFSHVAVECMISQRLLVIAGEVKSNAIVDVEKIARETLVKIGYISDEIGIDAHNCYVIQNIHQQSPDITQGVLKESTEIGAGDQGIIFGYACKETDQLMPLPITLAHQLTKKLTELRKDGILSYLLPDGKSQVTVEYTEDGHPLRVTDIIVSTQHRANISTQQLQSDLLVNLIKPVIPSSLLNE
ncbi:UNVERIFIED_CONTAM: methionine adenosyltransferase, partial [Escherichia coli]